MIAEELLAVESCQIQTVPHQSLGSGPFGHKSLKGTLFLFDVDRIIRTKGQL